MNFVRTMTILLATNLVSLMMLAVGLSVNWGEIRKNANRAIILRCIAIGMFFEPLIAIAIVKLFALGPLASGTILVMAITPGAPSLMLSSINAKGKSLHTAIALVLVLTVLSVLMLPISLRVINRVALLNLRVNSLKLFYSLATSVALPLALGMSIRSLKFKFSQRITPWVWSFFNLSFCVTVVLLIVTSIPVIINLPLQALVAMVLITFISVAMSHFTAPTYSLADRTLIGNAVVLGNPAIALYVSRMSYPNAQIFSAIAAYILIRSVCLFSYKLWIFS